MKNAHLLAWINCVVSTMKVYSKMPNKIKLMKWRAMRRACGGLYSWQDWQKRDTSNKKERQPAAFPTVKFQVPCQCRQAASPSQVASCNCKPSKTNYLTQHCNLLNPKRKRMSLCHPHPHCSPLTNFYLFCPVFSPICNKILVHLSLLLHYLGFCVFS